MLEQFPVVMIAVLLVGILFLSLLVDVLRRASRRSRIGTFVSMPLLNKSERRVFDMLGKAVPVAFGPRAHLFTQVSYGEFVKGSDAATNATIRQKRADFVVANEAFEVVCVIEFQGGGHWGRSASSRQNAERRDQAKRRALSGAGIPLVELPGNVKEADVADHLRRAVPHSSTESTGAEGVAGGEVAAAAMPRKT